MQIFTYLNFFMSDKSDEAKQINVNMLNDSVRVSIDHIDVVWQRVWYRVFVQLQFPASNIFKVINGEPSRVGWESVDLHSVRSRMDICCGCSGRTERYSFSESMEQLKKTIQQCNLAQRFLSVCLIYRHTRRQQYVLYYRVTCPENEAVVEPHVRRKRERRKEAMQNRLGTMCWMENIPTITCINFSRSSTEKGFAFPLNHNFLHFKRSNSWANTYIFISALSFRGQISITSTVFAICKRNLQISIKTQDSASIWKLQI